MNRSPLKFFLSVFALSIPFWLIQPRDWPISVSVGVPLIAALILVYREEGVGGVRRLLRRIFDQRKIRNKIWYVPIIFLMPLLYLLTYGVMALLRLPLHAEPYVSFLVIPLLFVLFFILGIGEEVGWTGYVTDPLQERWSALTTAIILGLVTALWHYVPLIQMGRSPTWIAGWTLWSVPLRIFIVWLYNNTGKSVFAVIVFHAMSNLSLLIFPIDYNQAITQFASGAVTVIAAVIVAFLWGSRTLARYRYA
jgi:uncharacterized protein